MGDILHDWNLDRKMHLIRSAYAALPEGGAFIIIEDIIDDSRRDNSFGLMMSLHMLIEFGDAFNFTGSDFARLVPGGRLPAGRDPATGRFRKRRHSLQVTTNTAAAARVPGIVIPERTGPVKLCRPTAG
jgi:hypothetical protein